MSATIAPLHHPSAWQGSAMTDASRWTRTLSPQQLEELLEATRAALAHGVHWSRMTREDFPLEQTLGLLEDIAGELEDGCGMVLVKGLPVADLADDELRTLWTGIGLHLGTLRPQNTDGERMREIRDEGQGTGERYGQIAAPQRGEVFLSSRARVASTGALRYHTDRADVVALLCVRQAAHGGVNRIASAIAVHNEMLSRYPEMAALLYQPYYRSRLGEESLDAAQAYPLPVFGVRDGKFTSHYSRTYIEAAQRTPAVPAMNEAQWQALDRLAELAEELSIQMRLVPGDMQFLNNHVIYHSRSEYVDGEREHQKRLLYRLWLSMPNSRALPEDHRVLWGNVAAGAIRGGIGAGS